MVMKMVKRLVMMVALMGVVLPLAAQTKKMSVKSSNFEGIEVSSYYKVEISKGNSAHAEITFSEELEPYVIARVTNGVLHLGLESDRMPRRMRNGNNRYVLSAKVVMPNLETLKGSGATSIEIDGAFSPRSFRGGLSGASVVKGLDLNTSSISFGCSGASNLYMKGKVSGAVNIDMSGASKVQIDQDVDRMEIEISGASNLKLAGKIKVLEIDQSGASKSEITGSGDLLELELSGASKFNGADFKVNNADIEASGASSADVYVMKRLKVDTSGSSTIRYEDVAGLQIDMKNVKGLIKR